MVLFVEQGYLAMEADDQAAVRTALRFVQRFAKTAGYMRGYN